MHEFLDSYPLPWSAHGNRWGTLTVKASNFNEIADFINRDKAYFIINTVNKNAEPLKEASIAEKISSVYYICWDDTFYLTRSGDWVRDIKKARMFKRKCEASNCINKNKYSDVKIVEKGVY